MNLRHRKAAQDVLRLLKSKGLPDYVCQLRACDLDSLIDCMAAIFGEERMSTVNLCEAHTLPVLAKKNALYSYAICGRGRVGKPQKLPVKAWDCVIITCEGFSDGSCLITRYANIGYSGYTEKLAGFIEATVSDSMGYPVIVAPKKERGLYWAPGTIHVPANQYICTRHALVIIEDVIRKTITPLGCVIADITKSPSVPAMRCSRSVNKAWREGSKQLQ